MVYLNDQDTWRQTIAQCFWWSMLSRLLPSFDPRIIQRLSWWIDKQDGAFVENQESNADMSLKTARKMKDGERICSCGRQNGIIDDDGVYRLSPGHISSCILTAKEADVSSNATRLERERVIGCSPCTVKIQRYDTWVFLSPWRQMRRLVRCAQWSRRSRDGVCVYGDENVSQRIKRLEQWCTGWMKKAIICPSYPTTIVSIRQSFTSLYDVTMHAGFSVILS